MAFFRCDGSQFEPTSFARSQWSPTAVNGSAVASLAAHVLERACPFDGLIPARLSLDLHSQPTFEPITVEISVIRSGRTVYTAEAQLVQQERTIARATLVHLRPGSDPAGRPWQPHAVVPPPPAAQGDRPHIFWGSGDDHSNWDESMAQHQNSERKRLWIHPVAAVDGHDATPFVRAACAGELTNTLTSWGDCGIGFINHDVTIALARLPVGRQVCLQADNHISDSGIAVGVSSMYDRAGRFGACVTSSVTNTTTALDLQDVSADQCVSPRYEQDPDNRIGAMH